MASGFDSSVSRIKPKTKNQFFRPKINSAEKSNTKEKTEHITPALIKEDTDIIEDAPKLKKVEKRNDVQNVNKDQKPDDAGDIPSGTGTGKKKVPLKKNATIQGEKTSDVEDAKKVVKLYVVHENNDPENVEQIESSSADTTDMPDPQSHPQVISLEETKKRLRAFRQREEIENVEAVETTVPPEESGVQSQENYRNPANETISQLLDFVSKEPEKSIEVQKETSGSVHDRYESLKKRLNAFINQDSGKSTKKNKVSENASAIKDVIRNYQSKIKHLTEELAVLEDTYKFTRDELSSVKQDLREKTEALDLATKLGQEKTLLSEEILKEMEIVVFERDRAFTSIAEFKTANKSMEELLEKAYISLEERAKELEEVRAHEKEFLQTIKQKDSEIQALQLVLAKRTADRDELFDRLEEMTLQLENIDTSNSALDEIKGLIDRGESGLE